MACVILIDEDASFARSLQILLEDDGGHHVLVAHSVHEAMVLLESTDEVHAVVSDLGALGGGLEQLAQVLQQWQSLTIVLLTAHPDPLSRREAARLGVSHYMVKPLEPERLLSVLEAPRPDQRST